MGSSPTQVILILPNHVEWINNSLLNESKQVDNLSLKLIIQKLEPLAYLLWQVLKFPKSKIANGHFRKRETEMIQILLETCSFLPDNG